MNIKTHHILSLVIGLSIFFISLSSSIFFYSRYSSEINRRINDRLIFGAKSVENGIDFLRIDELFLPGSENSEYYNQSHEHLTAMRKVFGLKYLYVNIIKDGKYIFVMDTADVKTESDYDPNDLTFLTEYKHFPQAMAQAFKTGQLQLTQEPYTDDWGTYLSAYYPVKDQNGHLLAVIGADYEIANVIRDRKDARSALAVIFLSIIGVTAAVLAAMNRLLFIPLAERTAALERANAELRQAMAQLVQSEKLAALGNLVAGIAHELNTPIGNAVMLASTLADQERSFRARMATGLSRSALNHFVEAVRENSDILQRSLERAAELISSFKQVAVDQASYQRRRFVLDEVVREIALALKPRLRRSVATLEINIAADLRLDSFPGPLGQVLMNLIQNALVHAFDGRAAGCIRIDSLPAGPGHLGLRVSDDGNGIAPAHLSRIFDPFFTTRLGQGGSGLGLHIVYNLVTGLLGGTIEAHSVPGHGAEFLLELPLSAPQQVAAPSSADLGSNPAPIPVLANG